MPDGALAATERQFLNLIESAAGGSPVNVSLYTLPDLSRSESGRNHISRYYLGIGDLLNTRLDLLIITGAEPSRTSLKDELYWGSLQTVLEWAEQNTYSTVLSCLAAHAGVLHFDGITRRRLSQKRFGIFECNNHSNHYLTAGIAPRFSVPHSRWNDLNNDELLACGYQVLSRTLDGNVDSFVKQQKSLFVFFQGHPEYDATALLLEYRRDVLRYLRGEADDYPLLPEGYFDQESLELLHRLELQAQSPGCKELLGQFPTAHLEERVRNNWQPNAMRSYKNLLDHIEESKGNNRLTTFASSSGKR
jgi:homoserine O-succinyltransferase